MVENRTARLRLLLTEIHPFTPRQAQIIEKIFVEERAYKEIAADLGISHQTVKNIVNGDRSTHSLGIYGRVERITGKRPMRHGELLNILLGDVLLLTSTPEMSLEKPGIVF